MLSDKERKREIADNFNIVGSLFGLFLLNIFTGVWDIAMKKVKTFMVGKIFLHWWSHESDTCFVY